MNPQLIDSHCHLTDPRLLGQIDAVVARARAAGVVCMITVGCGPDDAAKAVELADRYDDVFASAAVHPHDAGRSGPDDLARVEELLGRPKVVAVGEIGLDYHYDFAPRDAQRAFFERQLRLAGRLALPVIIHSREAVDDALAIIAAVRADGVAVRGVFHSFTGVAEEAERIVAAGFAVSLSGVVTFKNADGLRAAACVAPEDRLLIETDAPYLSPEPIRRVKVNEPAHLGHTLARLAELRGQSPETLAGRINRNTIELFGLPIA